MLEKDEYSIHMETELYENLTKMMHQGPRNLQRAPRKHRLLGLNMKLSQVSRVVQPIANNE